jgi:fatty-acid desaturase|tara:strand:- start:844 stop:1230 length:387 start_codon:yes stop_codon:yes gene_type:complete
MSVIKKLLTGDFLNNVNKIVDNISTSDEERMTLKSKLKQIILDAETKLEQEITQRHTNDMKSDSWLSKNVRPMTLIFLIVCTLLLIFIDAGMIEFNVKSEFVTLLSTTLVTTISFYFGSRGFEKIKRK